MTTAIFSTYAPSEGFGGPSRIYHQRRVLEAAGRKVIHVVVQAGHDAGAARRSIDLVHTVDRPFRGAIDHIYNDVDLAHRAAADRKLVHAICNHLQARDVTDIVLEQPFLVHLVEQIVEMLDLPVVYSCQNIEYRLRRELESFQFDWQRPKDRAEQVRELEVAAVRLARCVTSICPTDRDALRDEFGCDSTLVPNGSELAQLPVTAAWPDPIDFVFTGSAYWPNTTGFARIATPSLAFLPPDARIHVAGSVGPQLLKVPSIERHYSINASRLEIRGFLPMDELVSLMRSARAVLVPVFVGEGSNLKSADALACGRPVIMTERSTRGYEDVLEADDEGVTVVTDPTQFRSEMLRVLHTAAPAEVGHARRTMLSWSSRLAPLVDVIAAVERGGQPLVTPAQVKPTGSTDD